MHGWLIIDKPLGMSSAKAVAIAKKLTQSAKVGHAGTLDPLASGILPLALGEATKLSSYGLDGTKTYHFTIAFGEERDTGDAEGSVTHTNPYIPSEAELRQALPAFTGRITQIPPAFSALKINGKRAYQLAREGKDPLMEPRQVHISALTLVEYSQGQATLEAICGKGTYIRSLAQDIARACKAYGYVSMLRRVKVGKFGLEHAISLDKLQEIVHTARHCDFILPVDSVLDGIPVLNLSPENARRIKHGQVIPLSLPQEEHVQGVIAVKAENLLIALGTMVEGKLKPVRIFNVMQEKDQ